MADLTKTVAIIFEGEDKTSAVLSKIEGGLKGVDAEAKGAAGGLQRIGDGADGLGRAGANVTSLANAIKGLAIAAVVTEFISANVALEKFEKTMTVATGSTSAAAEEFDYVRGVAGRFGVELLDTADAYAKFSASAKGTALEGEGAKLIFEGFVGTMSRLGASSADVSGALVQLGQGVSKGKFELDDLKSIAERIPGFFAAFAESLGVSTGELYDLISAGKIGSKELLIFSDTLRGGLAGVDFDGFAASSARFKNAISEAYLQIGQVGVFDLFTKGVQIGTAAITGLGAGLGALGEIIGATAAALVSGDWSGFGDAVAEAMDKAGDKTRGARDAMLGLEDQSKSAGEAGEGAGKRIAEGMDEGAVAAAEVDKAFADVDKALKALGIDPKKFVDPIAEVKKAFDDLANNPVVSGEQFLAGFLVTLDKLNDGADIKALGDRLREQYDEGLLSIDKYVKGLDALDQKQAGTFISTDKATKAAKENADAVARQAKETEKAAEAAQKMKLELEKLASNERIKLIEARVTLNVAQIQADTERIKAAFSSLDNTVNSTGDVIKSLFDTLKGVFSAADPRFKVIEKQLDMENIRRDAALKLQEELTRAQIDEMKARTKSLLNGDALIKVDGAGLKPHLEAFMWEILRAIQTRVNKDGLRLLVGI